MRTYDQNSMSPSSSMGPASAQQKLQQQQQLVKPVAWGAPSSSGKGGGAWSGGGGSVRVRGRQFSTGTSSSIEEGGRTAHALAFEHTV